MVFLKLFVCPKASGLRLLSTLEMLCVNQRNKPVWHQFMSVLKIWKYAKNLEDFMDI